MKRFPAFILAALLAGGAQADVLIARGDGPDELRLYEGACVHGGTLARIDPARRDEFRKAQAEVNGKLLFGCWAEVPDADGIFFVLLEGGPGFVMQRRAFNFSPGD